MCIIHHIPFSVGDYTLKLWEYIIPHGIAIRLKFPANLKSPDTLIATISLCPFKYRRVCIWYQLTFVIILVVMLGIVTYVSIQTVIVNICKDTSSVELFSPVDYTLIRQLFSIY